MIKKMIGSAIIALLAFNVNAQSVCNSVYTFQAETKDGFDVISATTLVWGLPIADVKANQVSGMKVIDLASKLQDKGGPYTLEMGEMRSCDGKVATKVVENSIEVRGVTLKGFNQISRETLKQMGVITKRYEDRSAKGEKTGWDHSKGKKVVRNDVGVKQ